MEEVRNKRRSPIIALYFLLPTVNEKALKSSDATTMDKNKKQLRN